MPPQVGKPTTYQVTFTLTNSSNDFSTGVLTAFFPAGGYVQQSANSKEAQNVQYDPATSKLTWNVGALAANTGRFAQARTLTINLTLNPSAPQAGQQVLLVRTINFTATDLFTSEAINLAAQDIRTSDLQGQSGYSNGTVQQ